MNEELVPYKDSLPSINNILIENINSLTKMWLDEIDKNKNIKADKKTINKNIKPFLANMVTSLHDKKLPRIEREEFQSLRALIEDLKHNCLGVSCTVQDTTSYLMTLKTAFIKFLQGYFQDHKIEMRQEFQDFATFIDLLAFFVVQDYSASREAELQEFKRGVSIEKMRAKIIGSSKAMRDVFQKVNAVLDSDVSIVIEGETGTGKELVAQAIHFLGNRKDKPFITINCAAIPATLIESELFGYEKGAFTGADKQKAGKFEVAHGGTLFLDEIGELSLDIQVKLLRVLQSKQAVRLGGHEAVYFDVRIITATNKNLIQEVAQKKFREDLYYRIAVFPITMPPLRERGDDCLEIAEHFLQIENQKGSKNIKGFTEAAVQSIRQYKWPGNIRELENVIKRAYVITGAEVIDVKDFMFVNLLPAAKNLASSQYLTLEQIEKQEIQNRLKAFEGNISKAARSLGITRATLYKKIF